MRRVTLTLTHTVPSSNYCTELNGDYCRFCEKFKNGRAYCRLYDAPLVVDGDQVEKVRACCRATAGFETIIEDVPVVPQPATPTIDPKLVIKETIKMYNKNINELMNQGYPRPLAMKLAEQFILGGK